MKVIARQAFPFKGPRGRVEALADALEITRRSCYAYVSEERRVPEDIEQRFIALFGPVAEDGWRTVEVSHTRSRKPKATKGRPGQTKEIAKSRRDGWRDAAINTSTVLAQDVLGHVIRWEQNPLTIGQLAMLEDGLDEQEALAKYPKNYYALASDEDWVAQCNICGLIGAVDDREKEVNGLLFRVTCKTNSYKITEEG
jgi:hypothetical protein